MTHALPDAPVPHDDGPHDGDDDDDGDGPEIPRNRSIAKRRISHYGPTDLCDGCLNGTYQHTSACRQRFNRLLDAAEPLPRGDEVLNSEEHDEHEDQIHDILGCLTPLNLLMLNRLTLWIWILFLSVLQVPHLNHLKM